jgi:hypothetical protein
VNLRKSVGWWIILLFFLVPYLNLFRLDLHSGHYYWMTRRLSFDQPLPLLLTILMLVFLVLGLSTFRARLFCSAICPHNTLSKGLRWLERHRFDQPVAIVMTPLIAFTLISYFYEPRNAWRGIAYAESPTALAFFAVLCVFLGWLLLRLRSKFCQHACPYGFFQHLFTPANPTVLAKSLVALVLVVLAGAMTVTALSTTASEMSLKQVSRVQIGQTMTYVYQLGLTNNNRKAAEGFRVKFDPAGPQPEGAGLQDLLQVGPGESQQLTFALRTTQLVTVKFEVCAQREGVCKAFSTTLSGP